MLCGPIILKHLALPSEIVTFDKGFFTKVTDSVREVFSTFVKAWFP